MSSNQVFTESFIDRPVAEVWAVIADYNEFKKWNPLFWFEGGPFQEGGKIKLVVAVGPFKLRLPVTVETFREQSELRWVASGAGFRGSHWMRVAAVGENRTQITHGEEFSGLGLIWNFVRDDIRKEYQRATDAFVRYVSSN